eukprot:scaffold1195_cov358-Prasinococcus_capsulatus_cf.AAC.11
MAVVATLCAPRVPVAGLAGRGTAPLGARKSSRSCRARQPCLVYAAKGFGQKVRAEGCTLAACPSRNCGLRDHGYPR